MLKDKVLEKPKGALEPEKKSRAQAREGRLKTTTHFLLARLVE